MISPLNSEEAYIKWRTELEKKYALICKFCSRKVFDSDKKNEQQIFTKSKCPHCNTSPTKKNKNAKP